MIYSIPNKEEMNIIENTDFIKTISSLNVCLEERVKIKKELENVENDKDKIKNLKHTLKFCNGLCLSHINNLRNLVELEEEEEEEE